MFGAILLQDDVAGSQITYSALFIVVPSCGFGLFVGESLLCFHDQEEFICSFVLCYWSLLPPQPPSIAIEGSCRHGAVRVDEELGVFFGDGSKGSDAGKENTIHSNELCFEEAWVVRLQDKSNSEEVIENPAITLHELPFLHRASLLPFG